MQKYQSIITATNGSVIRNVPVTVIKEDGSLAEIFMDREGQVQAPNPLVTDSRGVFYFYAKNGRYSLRTAADGVQITDADTVLLFDPDETASDGPIADAVRRAEDAAERAETALSDSGLQNMVQDAQDAAANAVQAVIDANQAVASIDAALIEAGEAKEAAQAAAQTASEAAVDAQAVKDSLLDYGGALSAASEWSSVPAHVDLNLDAQAQALANRSELLRDNQKRTPLHFATLAEASAAADTLPDGQVVSARQEYKTYDVLSGALVNEQPTFPAGVGTLNRGQQERNSELIYITDFMSRAQISALKSSSGAVDMSTAMNAAIAALPAGGGEIYCPPLGLYRFNESFTSTGKNLYINAAAARFSVAKDKALFQLFGGWEHEQTITAITTNSFTVPNASLYKPEDIVKIRSSERLPINLDQGFKGEFATVDSVDAVTGVVTLAAPTYWTYAGDAALYVAKLSDALIRVDMMEVIQDPDDDQDGQMELLYIEAAKAAQIKIQNARYAFRGVGVAVSCFGGNFEIDNIDSSGIWYPSESRQRGGYGLVSTNTEFMNFRSEVIRRGRHATDAISSNRGVLPHSRCGAAAYNNYHVGTSVDSVATHFATHQGAMLNNIYGNAVRGEGGFVSFRGRGNAFRGGVAINVPGALAGNVVGTSTPNGDTGDSLVENLISRGSKGPIVASSGNGSGLLTLRNVDIEADANVQTRLFSVAGDGLVVESSRIKVTGTLSAAVAAISSSVKKFSFGKGSVLDLSDATLSSVRLVSNKSGSASTSSTLVTDISGLTVNAPASGFVNLYNDVALPIAGSVLGPVTINGAMTRIHSDFADPLLYPVTRGLVTVNGSVLVSPVGGGSATQASGKNNTVTINKRSGQITTDSSALAANSVVSFNLNNNLIGADDVISIIRKSGGTAGAYRVWVDSVVAGSAVICLQNISAGSLSESVVLQFDVRPGAVS